MTTIETEWEVIAGPGDLLDRVLQEGDLLVRRLDGSEALVGTVVAPALRAATEMIADGLACEVRGSGRFASVRGQDATTGRLVAYADGRVPLDQTILRSRAPKAPPTETATTATQVNGIDVSHHQGAVNWASVAGTSTKFAIAKATQRVADSQFATNWANIRANGLLRGAYHYFDGRNATSTGAAITPATQVTLFVSNVPRLLPGDLPPALDIEKGPAPHFDGLPAADVRTRCWEILQRLERRLGRRPFVYTGNDSWNDLGFPRPPTWHFEKYPLWVAHYTSNPAPRLPGAAAHHVIWTAYTIWQWTETGTVAGVTGNVDRNRFNGNIYQLRAYANLGHVGAVATSTRRRLVYTESDGHVHLLRSGTTAWTHDDLTALATSGNAAGDPCVDIVGSKPQVLFRRADGHIIEILKSGATWTSADRMSGIAPTPSIAVGDPSVFSFGGARHVVYWGDDDHVHELWSSGGRWRHFDLSNLAGATVAVSSNVRGYAMGATSQCVVYRGTDAHIHHLSAGATGGWSHRDLFTAASVPATVFATYDPAAAATDTRQVVAFRGDDDHIHRLAFDGTTWTYQDVTVASGSTAVPISGPSVAQVGGTDFIVFRATDGHVHLITSNGAASSSEDITAATAGVPAAAADPTAYVHGGALHVAFIGAGGLVHEVVRAWSHTDLDVATAASPSGDEAGAEEDGADQVGRPLPRGKGMFTQGPLSDEVRSPENLARRAAEVGLGWVAIAQAWSTDHGTQIRNDPATLASYVQALRAAVPGIQVFIWGYPHPQQTEPFARELIATAQQVNATGVIVDPEAPYKWNGRSEEAPRRAAATELMRLLAPLQLRGMSVGVTSYGRAQFHRNLPWEELAASADYGMPQIYEYRRGGAATFTADYPQRCLDDWRARHFTSIIPLSAAFDRTPDEMRDLLARTPVPNGALGWFRWATANMQRGAAWQVIREVSLIRA